MFKGWYQPWLESGPIGCELILCTSNKSPKIPVLNTRASILFGCFSVVSCHTLVQCVYLPLLLSSEQ